MDSLQNFALKNAKKFVGSFSLALKESCFSVLKYEKFSFSDLAEPVDVVFSRVSFSQF